MKPVQLFCLLLLSLKGTPLRAQCTFTANAGPDQVFTSTPVTIGGLLCGTGGGAGYSFTWTPAVFFTAGTTTAQCNPKVNPNTTTLYILSVRDPLGCVSKDTVFVINFITAASYIVPEKTIDGGYQVVKNGNVYFKFEEEYASSGTLNYSITDYNPSSANIQPPTLSCASSGTAKSLGDNRYSISTSCTPALSSPKFYLVEITNDKNEKFYFKFFN